MQHARARTVVAVAGAYDRYTSRKKEGVERLVMRLRPPCKLEKAGIKSPAILLAKWRLPMTKFAHDSHELGYPNV